VSTEVVFVAVAALARVASRHLLGNGFPAFGSELLNNDAKSSIFIGSEFATRNSVLASPVVETRDIQDDALHRTESGKTSSKWSSLKWDANKTFGKRKKEKKKESEKS
jgi:hypothetical protein